MTFRSGMSPTKHECRSGGYQTIKSEALTQVHGFGVSETKVASLEGIQCYGSLAADDFKAGGKGRHAGGEALQPPRGVQGEGEVALEETLHVGKVRVGGTEVAIRLTPTRLAWAVETRPGVPQEEGGRGGCMPLFRRQPTTNASIPLCDILGVTHEEPFSAVENKKYARTTTGTRLVVHHVVMGGSRKHPNKWRVRQIELVARSMDDCLAWVTRISDLLAASFPHRPRRILAFINPYGGKRIAPKVWERHAAPVLHLAEVDVRVVTTERKDHAYDVVRGLTAGELRELDGIVVVGGDGFFQEVLRGLMELRAEGAGEGKAAEAQLLAEGLRVGVIPAGSTDTVCCSAHGTRDPVTAALHIALGDRRAIDLLALDRGAGAGGRLYAASFAGHGFFGEVSRVSEKLRWMGTLRYEAAGTWAVLRGKRYELELEYLVEGGEAEAEGATPRAALGKSSSSTSLCRVNCEVCQDSPAAGRGRSGGVPFGSGLGGTPGSSLPGTGQEGIALGMADGTAAAAGTWRSVHGRYLAVSGSVLSCRTDQAPWGPARDAHLSDGLVTLIMVQETHPFNMLRFLNSITDGPGASKGPGRLQHVHVVKTRAFRLTMRGAGGEGGGAEGARAPPSDWNVDGEYMSSGSVKGRVMQSEVDIFARGPAH